MSRVILHIDMDAFFSQVEEVNNPGLKGKPVIICGDIHARSVVSTASYEARKYGVKSGMAVIKAKKLCPHAVYLGGNHRKYIYMSVQILKLLKEFTSNIEPFSIDEAFLEFKGVDLDEAVVLAKKIKKIIKSRFGLTGSVGISTNKYVAKMASGVDKPDGLTVIRKGEFLKTFGEHPVSALWGVGDKTAHKLKRLGITRVRELAAFPEGKLKALFGVYGSEIRAVANGRDDSQVVPYYEGPDPKSMGHEYTLPDDVEDRERLLATLLWLSEKVARRMRQEGYLGDTITVKIRDRDFHTITRQRRIEHQVDRDDIIYRVARRLFIENHRGEALRLLGVSVSGLVRKGEACAEPIFNRDRKYDRFISTMDSIRDKFGERAIRRGAGIIS